MLAPRLSYCLGFPQFMQNLPVLTCPQLQTHSADWGLGFPQFVQKFPVLT